MFKKSASSWGKGNVTGQTADSWRVQRNRRKAIEGCSYLQKKIIITRTTTAAAAAVKTRTTTTTTAATAVITRTTTTTTAAAAVITRTTVGLALLWLLTAFCNMLQHYSELK